MTQEEKQLLLKDLSARFPYGVICRLSAKDADVSITEKLNLGGLAYFISGTMDVKPYLRPLPSMTEEERKEYESFFSIGEYACGGTLYGEEYEYIADGPDDISQSICLFDWLDQHHFDYRGLIPMGLAIEAPEDMYKTR